MNSRTHTAGRTTWTRTPRTAEAAARRAWARANTPRTPESTPRTAEAAARRAWAARSR